jgi:hypothetical protein
MSAKTLGTKLVEFAYRNPVLRPLWVAWRRLRVVEQSPFENIYHCCTQKTASQWFRGIFADPLFADYTGLEEVPYIATGLKTAHFEAPFPPRTVATHLYIDYPTYLSIHKPQSYKTFFVMRDPRDIAVSWYFSALYSHAPLGPLFAIREQLQKLDQHAGMQLAIDQMETLGLFEAQRSWLAARNDPRVAIFRYEDLAADNRAFLKRLFTYLEVHMPDDAFETLWHRHSFARHAEGRSQGEEDKDSHYRKGIAGDWQNYFDEAVLAHFQTVTGDTLKQLGYASDAPGPRVS